MWHVKHFSWSTWELSCCVSPEWWIYHSTFHLRVLARTSWMFLPSQWKLQLDWVSFQQISWRLRKLWQGPSCVILDLNNQWSLRYLPSLIWSFSIKQFLELSKPQHHYWKAFLHCLGNIRSPCLHHGIDHQHHPANSKDFTHHLLSIRYFYVSLSNVLQEELSSPLLLWFVFQTHILDKMRH